MSLASVLLILFLAPPSRLFAAWTRPTGDKRPAILVAALLAVLVGALFTPAVSDYFGLTGAVPPVYNTVLPVLAIWFVCWGRLPVPGARPAAGSAGAAEGVTAPVLTADAQPPSSPLPVGRRTLGSWTGRRRVRSRRPRDRD